MKRKAATIAGLYTLSAILNPARSIVRSLLIEPNDAITQGVQTAKDHSDTNRRLLLFSPCAAMTCQCLDKECGTSIR